MTRKKVKLAYITNDTARKATFNKRKKGLLKKLNELTTLCGIEACAIIFNPFNSQPDLWPSALGLQRVLSKFKSLPEMEQCKKMVNQETYLCDRIAKATDQLKKLQRENREKEIARLMFQSLAAGGTPPPDLNVIDLNDLGWLVDQKVADVGKRMELLRVNQSMRAATREPSWFMEMMSRGVDDEDQMKFNIGDDVIQLPSFGEDDNHGAFWSNNTLFP
ncbi:agamous-like MADS-box protein AGL80 [Benincasa hispida]|uniref:agamous-like MADS-box protein AGL80 n=1 Tax=Benincasa hispida TaxID=102211 RepID=UPI0018FF4AB6|nr:agamous-like MADS-box protein AGL80 [Benincasa hispida]